MRACAMATFAGFAAIGVAFFQFGVGIAVERASPWETYLADAAGRARRAARRARPLGRRSSRPRPPATLVAVAVATTPASLSAARWIELVAALLVGTVPFALLGIALGYWAPERGALPIANLLYLGLSYAGGLWIRPQDLPRGVARISPLPTDAGARRCAHRDRRSAARFASGAWASLAGFAALFAALAVWGYRRDEGRRFR